MKKISRPPNPSKSIAFDSRGRIVCWGGGNRIAVLDPDQAKAVWVVTAWPVQDPKGGNIGKVYQKWQHIEGYGSKNPWS